ncbi:hypothetical protein BU16DRAFT_190704 [Lophium mytilinum]|uniref:Uncharacterized protein n=1 Tax=Lophium mytilinum TaxID=390894 RepID=A0A6A6R9A0_9PEZI|nr:hypothetical protein BU16DRAFT_190704 [Lophium mytilinum]
MWSWPASKTVGIGARHIHSLASRRARVIGKIAKMDAHKICGMYGNPIRPDARRGLLPLAVSVSAVGLRSCQAFLSGRKTYALSLSVDVGCGRVCFSGLLDRKSHLHGGILSSPITRGKNGEARVESGWQSNLASFCTWKWLTVQEWLKPSRRYSAEAASENPIAACRRIPGHASVQ